MQTIRFDREQAEVRLPLHELIVINNALNEVCHGIDVPEFSTRLGTSLEAAQALLAQVRSIIDQVERGTNKQ